MIPKEGIDNRALTNLPQYVAMSLCIPSGCNPSDVLDLGIDAFCVTKDDNTLEAGDIACM